MLQNLCGKIKLEHVIKTVEIVTAAGALATAILPNDMKRMDLIINKKVEAEVAKQVADIMKQMNK